MTVLRIDPHAHLYDAYPTQAWCEAAMRNLGVGPHVTALVVVVDRKGQDSLTRLRQEVPAFATWRDGDTGKWGVIEQAGRRLYVVQGVQYVASERIEVLGLGVGRSLDDGFPASQYIASIRECGGVPCLPWSPGKWLGKRGQVVRGLLESHSPHDLTVGDIAIRSRVGPPSLLLRFALRRGYRVLYGTDPLPLPEDAELVGSFGVELVDVSFDVRGMGVAESVKALASSSTRVRPIGRRNSGYLAAKRFVTQSLKFS